MAGQPPHAADPQSALCARLGLPPPTPNLLLALTHPSFANEVVVGQGTDLDNQRLEFLGDAVLGVCVSEMLMRAFPHVDEGELTLMRAHLVNASALAGAARDIALGDALQLGRGADAAGERKRKNVLADALEAVLGAVYLDHGLDTAKALTEKLVGPALAKLVAAGGMQRDPKSRLQERVQADGYDAPRYQLVGTEGPPHDRTFTASVEVPVTIEDGPISVRGEGQGRSKKLAEQAAAEAALSELDQRARATPDSGSSSD